MNESLLASARRFLEERRHGLETPTALDAYFERFAQRVLDRQPRMDATIAQLPLLGSASPTDVLPIYHNGSTYGVLAGALVTASPTTLFLTVKDFGAKGDGVTDDSDAIIAWMKACAGGAGFMQAGIYLFSKPLNYIAQNTSLCAIPGTVIVRAMSNTSPGVGFASSNTVPGQATPAVEFSGCHIDGIIFDMQGSSQAWGTGAPQAACLLVGSDMHVTRCVFLNCGNAAQTAGATPTGLWIVASVENPINGSRVVATDNLFVNCTGQASWMSNLKGGSASNVQNSYGFQGLNDFSRQRFINCLAGVKIEDRCNGFVAEGLEYYGNTSTANGSAFDVPFGSNGRITGVAANAGVALSIEGNTTYPSENIIVDIFADNCSSAGVKLTGGTAIAATLNGAVSAGATSIALTVTGGAVGIGAWLGISDGVTSEVVNVSGWNGSSGVASLAAPLRYSHASGIGVASDSGLRNVMGNIIVRDCGGTYDGVGVQIQSAWDCSLNVRSYDSRAQLFAPGSYDPDITQQKSIAFLLSSRRCIVYGNLYGSRDGAVLDDGTNTDCVVMGIVGGSTASGGQIASSATVQTYDVNLASQFYGTGAPNANLGKNGDVYLRTDAAPQQSYKKLAGAWVPSQFSPQGLQTAPSIPASGIAFTNPFLFPADVYVTGGTVTVIAKNGTALGITAGYLHLEVGDTVTLTYSAAPSWVWFGAGA